MPNKDKRRASDDLEDTEISHQKRKVSKQVDDSTTAEGSAPIIAQAPPLPKILKNKNLENRRLVQTEDIPNVINTFFSFSEAEPLIYLERDFSGLSRDIVYLNNTFYAVHPQNIRHKKSDAFDDPSDITTDLVQNIQSGEWALLKTVNIKSPQSSFINTTNNELKILRDLNQLNNYLSSNNTIYIIKKYIEGVNLRSLTTLSFEEKCEVAEKMCKSVQDFHKLGYLHCDISLENFIYDASMDDSTKRVHISLIDFDSALLKDKENKATTHVFQAKPGLIPPEFLIASTTPDVPTYTYSESTEVYCLGLSYQQLFEKELAISNTSSQGLYGNVPIEKKMLKDLFNRMTSNDPEARPTLEECQKEISAHVSKLRDEKRLTTTSEKSTKSNISI